MATALVNAKLGVRVEHVEAGLRSFDWTMPEEINRVLTDRLADFLFTPSEDGDVNLAHEGVPGERIFRVGNGMIDSLVRLLPSAMQCPKNGFPERYALVTLHRPSNVDDSTTLKSILQSLLEINEDLAVVFPTRPRTRQPIEEFGFDAGKLHMSGPVPYVKFLALQHRAAVVIIDSGGIQEETAYLGVPCLTLRNNSERPVIVTLGTNVVVGQGRDKLSSELSRIVAGRAKKGITPPLWDGHAGERIADVIQTIQ